MSSRSRVGVAGPLVAFAPGFRADLARQGYMPETADEQLRLMAHAGSDVPRDAHALCRRMRMFAFSSAAGAAVATPLVSTSTSDSGGGSVGDGTVLKRDVQRGTGAGGLLQLDADGRVERRHAELGGGDPERLRQGHEHRFHRARRDELVAVCARDPGIDGRERLLRESVGSRRQRPGRQVLCALVGRPGHRQLQRSRHGRVELFAHVDRRLGQRSH